jgi:hypothetical protein
MNNFVFNNSLKVLLVSILSNIAIALISIQFLPLLGEQLDLTSLFFFSFFLTLGLLGSYATSLLLALLPVLPGLGQQLSFFSPDAHIKTSELALNAIAGLFIATVVQAIFDKQRSKLFCSPLPIAIALGFLTISCALAIVRNLWQSGTVLSVYGTLLNLGSLDANGWHDSYWPVNTWLVFAGSCAFMSVLSYHLQKGGNPNSFIFKPLLCGLLASAGWGVIQQITGLGLNPNRTGEGRLGIGGGVYGFSPDIHAFAGIMLLGAVGLLGYLQIIQSRRQRLFIYFLIFSCWFALWFSKSRASLLLAVAVLLIVLLRWMLKKKNDTRLLLGVGALFGCASAGLAFFGSNLWIGQLAALFKTDAIFNYAYFNTLFAHRPEFFEAALRMFAEFPLMGVGLGNFYRLSSDANLTGSAYLAQIGGENAHNYFLQMLAELGLVGVTILGFAVLAPISMIAKRSLLLPAYCALGALCLGNLFAHSFLVKETFLIASALLALAYAQVRRSPKNTTAIMHPFSATQHWLFALGGLLFVGLLTHEIYRSFYRAPFEFGRLCFVEQPLTSEGWTRGELTVTLPANTRGLKIQLISTQPDVALRPLLGHLSINDVAGVVLAGQTAEWTSDGRSSLEVAIDSDYFSTEQKKLGPLSAKLRISRCFIPRNLGLNSDKRLLGVRIEHIEFLN